MLKKTEYMNKNTNPESEFFVTSTHPKTGKCWNCGTDLGANDYGRQDICPKCGRDTKTCKGCFFYDRNAHNECHESQAERVVEKERSNFCDYFKPATRAANNAAESRNAMKAAAEALFKKKP